jgi:hypothetical protein
LWFLLVTFRYRVSKSSDSWIYVFFGRAALAFGMRRGGTIAKVDFKAGGFGIAQEND